jgi:hypothetical protein
MIDDDDMFGEGVNVAAREGLSGSGSILAVITATNEAGSLTR